MRRQLKRPTGCRLGLLRKPPGEGDFGHRVPDFHPLGSQFNCGLGRGGGFVELVQPKLRAGQVVQALRARRGRGRTRQQRLGGGGISPEKQLGTQGIARQRVPRVDGQDALGMWFGRRIVSQGDAEAERRFQKARVARILFKRVLRIAQGLNEIARAHGGLDGQRRG